MAIDFVSLVNSIENPDQNKVSPPPSSATPRKGIDFVKLVQGLDLPPPPVPPTPEPSFFDKTLPKAKNALSKAASAISTGIKGASGPGVKNPNQIDPALETRLRALGSVDISGKTIVSPDIARKALEEKKTGISPQTHLPMGSVLPPSPTNLRTSLPSSEPVAFDLNPAKQKLSPNAVAGLTIKNASARQATENEYTQKLRSERPGAFSPFAAPMAASMLFLGPEFIEAPISTAGKLAVFGGLQSLEQKLNLRLSRLVPDQLGENTKEVADLLQMLGNGLLSHGVIEKAPAIADTFTKNVVEHYNLPKQVYIPSETIKDIFQTGKLATPGQLDQFAKLTGGDRVKINQAIENGLEVAVPAEKVVSITDKPYWAKIKAALKLAPTNKTTVTPLGETTQAPRALIENKSTSESPVVPSSPTALPEPSPVLGLPFNQSPASVQGNNFSMKPVASKQELTTAKLYANYQSAVQAFTKKPTEANMQKALELRAQIKASQPAIQLPSAEPQKTALTASGASVSGAEPRGMVFAPKAVPSPVLSQKTAIPETVPPSQPSAPQGLSFVTPKPTEPVMPEGAPASTAEKGTSKVAKRVEAKAIEKGLTEKLGHLAEFDKITIADQSRKIAELLNNDYQGVLKILDGTAPVPKGLHPVTVLTEMDRLATETRNGELAQKVASSPLASETSIYAQGMRLLQELDPESPVAAIKDIEKAWEKKAAAKAKRPAKDPAAEFDFYIKKARPTKQDWTSFINELKCK